ncbi:MAG: DUF6106 family protein [Roseburia sp.]|nr:DUF6106 family protein [Roseburia sp.]
MEQLYAESSVKQKTTAKVTVLKTILIIGVIFLLGIGFLSGNTLLALLAVVAVIALVWYWPRFQIEWEYVFCDGQIDFDQILGGQKRKTILRIELDDADVIAPMTSSRLDGYRHLPVRDFSSLSPDAEKYGIAIRLEGKEDKTVLVFEPNAKMLRMIHTKFPKKTEIPESVLE